MANSELGLIVIVAIVVVMTVNTFRHNRGEHVGSNLAVMHLWCHRCDAEWKAIRRPRRKNYKAARQAQQKGVRSRKAEPPRAEDVAAPAVSASLPPPPVSYASATSSASRSPALYVVGTVVAIAVLGAIVVGAYNVGWNAGQRGGFNAGKSQAEAAIKQATDSAYSNGVESGKSLGYDSGYSAGKQVGVSVGRIAGAKAACWWVFNRLHTSRIQSPSGYYYDVTICRDIGRYI